MILGFWEGLTNVIVDSILVPIGVAIVTFVSIPYRLSSALFAVFFDLIEFEGFGEGVLNNFRYNIYVILGIIAVFLFSYYLLTWIIDPDKNKGGAETGKLIKKVTISFILIVLCPTIFNFSSDVVHAIIKNNVIGKIVTGDFTNNDFDNNVSSGTKMGSTLWKSFFYPVKKDCDSDEASCIVERNKVVHHSGVIKYELADADAMADVGIYSYYGNFARNWIARGLIGDLGTDETPIRFEWFIALIVGWYMAFVVFKMCYDMAVRMVKLSFYQICSPICIICNAIPGKEGVFTNWKNAIFKTYVSAFIKIFLVVMTTYLLGQITPIIQKGAHGLFYNTLVYVALIVFMKDGTKYMDELFGLGDTHVGVGEAFKGLGIGEGVGKVAGIGLGATALAGGFLLGRKDKNMSFKNRVANALDAAKESYKNKNLSGLTSVQNSEEQFRRETSGMTPEQIAQLRKDQWMDKIRKKAGLNTSETIRDQNAEAPKSGKYYMDAEGKMHLKPGNDIGYGIDMDQAAKTYKQKIGYDKMTKAEQQEVDDSLMNEKLHGEHTIKPEDEASWSKKKIELDNQIKNLDKQKDTLQAAKDRVDAGENARNLLDEEALKKGFTDGKASGDIKVKLPDRKEEITTLKNEIGKIDNDIADISSKKDNGEITSTIADEKIKSLESEKQIKMNQIEKLSNREYELNDVNRDSAMLKVNTDLENGNITPTEHKIIIDYINKDFKNEVKAKYILDEVDNNVGVQDLLTNMMQTAEIKEINNIKGSIDWENDKNDYYKTIGFNPTSVDESVRKNYEQAYEITAKLKTQNIGLKCKYDEDTKRFVYETDSIGISADDKRRNLTDFMKKLKDDAEQSISSINEQMKPIELQKKALQAKSDLIDSASKQVTFMRDELKKGKSSDSSDVVIVDK